MNYTNISRGKRKDNPNEWVYGYYYCVFADEESEHKAFTDRGLIFPDSEDFHHYILPIDGECAKNKTIEDSRVEIIPKTYGLCSMIPDNTNSRMLFTGDIVKVSVAEAEDVLCIVSFGNCGGAHNVKSSVGYMGFYLEPGNELSKKLMNFCLRNDPLYFYGKQRLEVVGNIHDDPQLLI